MARHPYVQPVGTNTGQKYFQDVEISPATVKDGTLARRFDLKTYPERQSVNSANTTTVVSASSTTPVHAVPVVLTATVANVGAGGSKATGVVTFKDGGTTLGTGTLNAAGVATYNVAGGFAAGVHTITAVAAGDGTHESSTSAVLTLTVS